MSNKLAAVPVLTGKDQALTAFAEVVKQNLDQISGQNRNAPQINKLPLTASLVDLLVEFNKLVDRVQNP